MFNFIKNLIGQTRAVLFLFVMLLILGTKAYNHVPKEWDPDVQIPFYYVTIYYNGISAADAEKLLTKPLETQLKLVDGLKKITSYSYYNGASVNLEFNAGLDPKAILNDIRDKVNQAKKDLPSDAEDPQVHEINLSKEPVLTVFVSGDLPQKTLITIAKDLKQTISSVKDVSLVDLYYQKESLEIQPEPAMLARYNITADDLVNLIQANNALIAAGNIDDKTGYFTIKINGLINNFMDLMEFPVKSIEGNIIKIKDIATVKNGLEDQTQITRVNLENALALEISKRIGSNLLGVIDNVKLVVEEAKKSLPANVKISYSKDVSKSIRNELSELENNIILAVILSLIPVMLSIGTRSGILVALSIPSSFLMGVLIIKTLGASLNIVVIFSLILSIGLLVDAAIVVVEYADRKMAENFSPADAFAASCKRMIWPVFNGTAVTLIVFFPLFFWPGVMGEFMKFMPLTIIATVGSSLIVSYVFIPVIGTLMSKNKVISEEERKSILASEEGRIEDLRGAPLIYANIMRVILKRPLFWACIVIASLVSSVILYIVFGKGAQFFPDIEPELSHIYVEARGNLSVKEKNNIVTKVENIVKDYQKEIDIIYTKVKATDSEEDTHDIKVNLEYGDWKTRRKAEIIKNELREKLNNIHGVKIEIADEKNGPPSGFKQIAIEVKGSDFQKLESFVDYIRSKMEKLEGLYDISDSRELPLIEWEIMIDREKATKYGLNINIIGNFITMITKGYEITKYTPDDNDDRVKVLVRFPKEKRNLSTLENLLINSPTGPVALKNFATIKPVKKQDTITRVGGVRTITVESNMKKGFYLEDMIKKITNAINKDSLPDGVSIKFVGEHEDQQETANFLNNAFGLGIIGMLFIVLIQFNSFYQTMVVMSAAFLSTAGVFIGLLVTGQSFGVVMCGIGIIVLAGTVVNHNILLIDTYKHLKDAGEKTEIAIIKSGAQRLRPVFLTTATAVLGLIPMIIGLSINFADMSIHFDSPSSQWWTQLSTTIAGGMTFATILTLVFNPCLLALEERIKSKFKWLVNK